MGVPVKGYEDFYSIDEFGNVYSFRSKKFLKPTKGNNGYYTIELNVKGKAKRLLVHRLVAQAYLPNPFNLPQVNHKDENKENNHISNLEWCTAKYNMTYGNAPRARKESRAWYTKTEEIKQIAQKNGKRVSKPVLKIDGFGNVLDVYDSAKQAATKNNVNHSHVCECCLGKRYKTVGGYIWKYK